MAKIRHVYRKKLREEMGLDEGKIIPIVARTYTFQGFPSQQGYATQYDFNQAFLISVGCETLSLGLSLRYADLILTYLSGRTNGKFYKAIREQRLVLTVAPSLIEALGKETTRTGKRRAIPTHTPAGFCLLTEATGVTIGKNIVTNQEICVESGKEFHDKQISPLTLLIEKEGAKKLHDESFKGVIKSFITIELYSIVENLDKLFE
ncbi:MAG: hypothetical protein GY797_04225 [Deltaproteobacteria bacterium]|nr:hypothetical protein [Deltaproteobacteria bacterium]